MAKIPPYIVLDLIQGTPEWNEARFDYPVTASQVASLFGLCPYTKRDALMNEKLTRQEREVNEFKTVLFERAHKAESVCRDFVRDEYKIEFKPAVIVSKKCPHLLASLDGFNAEHGIIFEAKYMGDKAIEELKQGKIKPHHMMQVQAQLFASGAEKCVYFGLSQTNQAAYIEIWPDKFYRLMIPQAINTFAEELLAKKLELGVTK